MRNPSYASLRRTWLNDSSYLARQLHRGLLHRGCRRPPAAAPPLPHHEECQGSGLYDATRTQTRGGALHLENGVFPEHRIQSLTWGQRAQVTPRERKRHEGKKEGKTAKDAKRFSIH